MSIDPKKTILLFYRDFERDSFFKNDRYIKRVLRPVYQLVSRNQKVSGFYVWYTLLVKGLRQAGYDVRINDSRAARENPDHPVGIVGYSSALEEFCLPNPAVLGPCLFDHPKQAPDLMRNPKNAFYLVTCDWMQAMFEPYYGTKCAQWYAGIDTEEWPDQKAHPKDNDVLIYDKIRWQYDHYQEGLLSPILRSLERRGLTHRTVRYRFYDHKMYKSLLARSRAMVFLCESETQGMAYQEALASNVPVFAWDNGFWRDPMRAMFEPNPVPATSVPYFSAECGDRFQDYEEFAARFDGFWSRLDSYQPRAYVQRALSFPGSAARYVEYYFGAART